MRVLQLVCFEAVPLGFFRAGKALPMEVDALGTEMLVSAIGFGDLCLCVWVVLHGAICMQ